MMARSIVLAAAVACALAGCKKAEKEELSKPGATVADGHADEKKHDELPKVVKLTPDVVRSADVRTAPARLRRMAATVDLNGQVVANPEATAMIGARVSGRVVRVALREGDTIAAGKVVAVITSPEVAKLRSSWAAATARAAAVRGNATRLRELFRERLGAEQEAVGAEAEATASEAERDAQGRTLRGLGVPLQASGDPSLVVLTSPIAGSVVQLDAALGQAVEPAHTLATVSDLSRVWFQAQLFEKDLGRVEEEATAEVRLNGYPDRVFTARVARISGRVDPQARTLTARLALRDPEHKLRLGLFGTARVSVRSADSREQLAVPLSAITDLGERKAVFVRHEHDDYEVHDVQLGQTAGGFVGVLSGLKEGEEVVVSGVHTLRSVVLKGSMKDGD